MGTRFRDWLNALPPEEPPAGLAERVRRAQRDELAGARLRSRKRGLALALAASVVAAVVLALVLPQPPTAPNGELQALRDRA